MIESSLSLTEMAGEIGAAVAAPVADAVDRDARFPHEAVDAYRERGLLSALIPRELGGGGAALSEVSDAVRAVAAHCASSALVLAMHSIEIGNLVRHGTTEPLRELQREIVSEQLLFANANSEVGIGGDVGRSRCAVEIVDGRPTLVKDALAISYGESADIVVATARRTADSEETDQVQAICRRPQLEALSEWDATGLRGTCSRGFRLRAEIDSELVYPVGFAVIGSTGGLHASQLLLSSVWVGLAEASAAKAHAFVRAAARREIGTTPKSALRLAELGATLDMARGMLESIARRLDGALGTDDVDNPQLLAALRNLKVATSQAGVDVARMALEICGIVGYKRDTPFSLDRQLRDSYGGLVMISNDRYLHANAQMLVARKRM
jgi:acyl-CoA dehydrogenase